ncbi:MAG: F0F1 ATP synthase subunit gamma [Candidatus Competibacteraceae bacterium]|nr:F0F1 ATP synthase subunit gamma [Candidatus Competibacteraceae bacterium]
MAGAKEIRNKIRSIRNTQKITRAMEMVAASKMRKAQERMKSSRPYSEKIRRVVSHLSHAHTDYQHPFLLDREVKRVGYIVVSTDRGLCGGLNANLFRQMVRSMKEWRDKGAEIDLCVIGTKAAGFFRRFGGNIVAQTSHLGDAPRAEDLIGTVKVMLDAYMEGRIDRLFIASNEFVNTMTQSPRVEQLIPVVAPETSEEQPHRWDYIYEPESKELLDLLFDRYIESLVYQGVVDNIASEMAARMVAMKAASENAGTLIDELELIYNKARQSSITQELSEIVAGAAAV